MDKRHRLFEKRRQRVRNKLRAISSTERPRLSVHRTGQHIYVQVIDDTKGATLAAASSVDTELKGSLKSGSNIEAATKVGELIAKRASDAGIKEVVFDRGGFIYHGRVKALAEAAREGGLTF
jgi:large subunit ribosomal protein L18